MVWGRGFRVQGLANNRLVWFGEHRVLLFGVEG